MLFLESEFVEQREPSWKRLHFLCDKSENSVNNLSVSELRELISLYRSTSVDLARAQTESHNLTLINDLNAIVGRAYAVIYRAPTQRLSDTVRAMLTAAARSTRKLKWFILATLIPFFLGIVVSSVTLTVRPDLRHHLVSAQEESLFDHWAKAEFEAPEGMEQTEMWMFYASHNPMVLLLNVSSGLGSGGILSTAMVYRMGIQLGALSHKMQEVDKLPFLITSLMPHGASELNGLFVGAGAGLALGWAWLVPGRRSRTMAVRETGKHALVVALQAFIMMLIAAPFEGFFSFSPQFPQWLKGMVGVFVLAAWLLFWTFYARDPELESGTNK